MILFPPHLLPPKPSGQLSPLSLKWYRNLHRSSRCNFLNPRHLHQDTATELVRPTVYRDQWHHGLGRKGNQRSNKTLWKKLWEAAADRGLRPAQT